jgi:hypothetical protein
MNNDVTIAETAQLLLRSALQRSVEFAACFVAASLFFVLASLSRPQVLACNEIIAGIKGSGPPEL